MARRGDPYRKATNTNRGRRWATEAVTDPPVPRPPITPPFTPLDLTEET